MNTDTPKTDVSIGDNPTLAVSSGESGVSPLHSRPGGRFAVGDVILGRYTVLRELGEGGMGVVYQCLDSVGGVEVAVKGLPPEVSRNAEEMEDIRMNYQLVRNLRHPNIAGVATLEQDKATGDYYLVMDLAKGITLKSWMRRNPAASCGTKLAILSQIAAALDYAHAEKVIHRDVKPENVMVDAEGRVKVLDFGLAAQIRSSQSRTSNVVTSKGGTPGYKSPEQWLGRPQRAAADVYSFGVLAYWMLAGHLPFDGDDPVVLGHAVLTAPVEPVEGLPACMNDALAKALAKKPEERFSTCGAFMAALEGEGDLSRKERKDRKEEGGSQLAATANHANTGGAQLVAPETGGSRSRATAPLLIAAALALAVLGGWWLFGGRARSPSAPQTGTTGVSPVEYGFTTGTTGVSPVASAKPTAPRPRPVVTEADVANIAVEAAVQKDRIGRIDDSDGFKKLKDDLADKLARATANGKAKRWGEAAIQFTNYVNECKVLIALHSDRQNAVAARTKMEEARARAVAAEAEKYAGTRWNATLKLQSSAADKFSAMDFQAANSMYSSAEAQFSSCAEEAKKRAEEEARERARRAKWRKEGEPFILNDPYGLYLTMKWCPPGTFMMGSPPSEEGRDNDEPQHQVTLTKGFWLGETEVTQGQWKKVMNGETVVDLARKGLQDDTLYNLSGGKKTLREFWGMSRDGDPHNRCGDLKDDVPVYNVSWNEAAEFCRRLTQKERTAGRIPDGYEYRLPTEAEWEYACRAGSTTALPNNRDIRILGDNNAPALDDIAWYGGNSSVGFSGDGWITDGWKDKQYPGGKAFAREVKGKRANNWGLYDMIGNVWEWCDDWYGAYPDGSATDPTGPVSGASRVNRGGSWYVNARLCRSAARDRGEPGYRSIILGFRVALAPSH